MAIFDLRHPFFLPLWRRVATTVATAGWALFELISGSPGWAVLFGGVAVWLCYGFFIAFDPEQYRDKDND